MGIAAAPFVRCGSQRVECPWERVDGNNPSQQSFVAEGLASPINKRGGGFRRPSALTHRHVVPSVRPSPRAHTHHRTYAITYSSTDRPTILNETSRCQPMKPRCPTLKVPSTPAHPAQPSNSRRPPANRQSNDPLSIPHRLNANRPAIPTRAGRMTTNGRCRRIWIDWCGRLSMAIPLVI